MKLVEKMVNPDKVTKSVVAQNKSGSGNCVNSVGAVQEGIYCLFCKKTAGNKCSVNQNDHLKAAMRSICLEYYPLDSVVDYGCFDCIKTILVVAEQRRMLQRNILKNRANYFIRCGNKKMCAKFLAQTRTAGNNYFFANLSGPSPLKITNVRSINAEVITNGDNHEDSMDDSQDDPVDSSPNKLLDVMYERCESVLATESGGKVHNSNIRNTNKSSGFSCKHCSRTFTRQTFLKRHEKKHTTPTVQKPKYKIGFICEECNVSFESLAVLRKHEMIHKHRFKCPYCPEEFLIRSKRDLHEAICLGKKEAKETNGDANHKTYNTRSKKLVHSESETEEDSTDIDSLHSIRMTNLTKWIGEIESDNESINSGPISHCTSFSRTSSRVSSTYTETGTEDTSSCITSSGKRKKSVEKDSTWSEKRARRRKLINEEFKKWICPEEDCGYMDGSLNSLMAHDIECHDPLPLFYCKKCRGRFVRKFYYEHHLKLQSYGRWVCCLCEAQFDNEPDLKNHFDDHKDTDPHPCDICKLYFMTEHELQKHLCTADHLKRKRTRKCIFLERCVYSVKKEIEEDENENESEKEKEKEEEQAKPYTSHIRILKLMDEERVTKFPFEMNLKWKTGVVFKFRRQDNTHNCAGLEIPT